MIQYIDKSDILIELEKRYKYWKEKEFNSHSTESEIRMSECQHLMLLFNTLEVKEINTWHLQKNEDIYNAVKDWSLHSFICLMDDGTVQKFTGILCEYADGSINTHIDAFFDDSYNVNNIIFWIEMPNL